jgi:adenylate kinase
MVATFDPFADCGASAKTKLLHLGLPDSYLMSRVRSLNLEHVSPAELMRSEISRHSGQPAAGEAALASMRRWFFARKPDAGFFLTEFPATLLQANVFDEWLDARGETLHGVLPGENAPAAVVEHYRTLGLLIETAGPASA